jgi:hypothetical protein
MTDKQTGAPQKQVHWANDYGAGCGVWHKTRQHADDRCAWNRVGVIRREQTGDKIEYYKENV